MESLIPYSLLIVTKWRALLKPYHSKSYTTEKYFNNFKKNKTTETHFT